MSLEEFSFRISGKDLLWVFFVVWRLKRALVGVGTVGEGRRLMETWEFDGT
jgi:hypothetical protein